MLGGDRGQLWQGKGAGSWDGDASTRARFTLSVAEQPVCLQQPLQMTTWKLGAEPLDRQRRQWKR